MNLNRRHFLMTAAGAFAARTLIAAPASPVAIARCRTYGVGLTPTMQRMFDGIGGLGKLVNGKTVAIKVNLTGSPSIRLNHEPQGLAHWTNPNVIAVTVKLLSDAGAKRIRILESPWSTAEPIEEYILAANWDPSRILSAGKRVEFENTNYLGNAKKYSRFDVPNGGHLFKTYYLNHSYEDCDVFVSIAKLKEHGTTGVTMSMKNCFGITPCTIYGDGAGGVDEPLLVPRGGRGTVFHRGAKQPAKIAPTENDPTSSREDGYRVPRAVSDLVAARPIHLAIIDGVETMAGGEGPWVHNVPGGPRRISPGVMIAGLNPVCTDAVGAAVMGFDPMSDRGTAPFEHSDNMLRLAEELGVGTRDLSKIEVAGMQIADARFPFRKA
jgi:uncharacterized protein (DUF362 family)